MSAYLYSEPPAYDETKYDDEPRLPSYEESCEQERLDAQRTALESERAQLILAVRELDRIRMEMEERIRAEMEERVRQEVVEKIRQEVEEREKTWRQEMRLEKEMEIHLAKEEMKNTIRAELLSDLVLGKWIPAEIEQGVRHKIAQQEKQEEERKEREKKEEEERILREKREEAARVAQHNNRQAIAKAMSEPRVAKSWSDRKEFSIWSEPYMFWRGGRQEGRYPGRSACELEALYKVSKRFTCDGKLSGEYVWYNTPGSGTIGQYYGLVVHGVPVESFRERYGEYPTTVTPNEHYRQKMIIDSGHITEVILTKIIINGVEYDGTEPPLYE